MARLFLLTVCTGLLCLSGCGRSGGDSETVATIDAEVPSTQVFYRQTLLGTTPLRVTRSTCEQHGFTIPHGNLIDDGWGEGMAFGTEDEDESKIMFLVPESARDRYLSIETPWGIRTKLGNSKVNHGHPVERKTDFMTLVGEDGIRLKAHPLSDAKPNSKISIQFTLSGTGSQVITGYRPELVAYWGTFDTPWRHRSSSTMALDDKFRTIAPGDTHELSMTIEAPDVAENYSLFVVFNLFAEETGGFSEIGAVYSESRLLRIRR